MAESEAPDDGSDRRAWIKLGLWTLAIIAFLVLVAAAMRFEERATFRCPHCLSTMESKCVGFKISRLPAFGGTPRSVVTPSVVCREVFGGGCAHRWPLVTFSATDPEREGLVTRQITGTSLAKNNPLAEGYTTTPRFRTLVRERLASGTLARPRARELFSLPNDALDTFCNLSGDELRALLDEANALLEAAGLPPHPAWVPRQQKK